MVRTVSVTKTHSSEHSSDIKIVGGQFSVSGRSISQTEGVVMMSRRVCRNIAVACGYRTTALTVIYPTNASIGIQYALT